MSDTVNKSIFKRSYDFINKILTKLFGGINMTWVKVIIFAICTGVYTALINMVPILQGTSFQDIAISYERWVLFAVIIAFNCKKPVECALKVFVFFLISQPLVFIVELPMIGFHSAYYYFMSWLPMIIATLPGGFIAFYARKNNILGTLIISVANGIMALMLSSFIFIPIKHFPNHLYSVIFCIVVILIFSLKLVKKNYLRIIALALSVIACICGIYLMSSSKGDSSYGTPVIPVNYASYSMSVDDGSYFVDGGDDQSTTYHFDLSTFQDKDVTFTYSDGTEVTLEITKSEKDGFVSIHLKE